LAPPTRSMCLTRLPFSTNSTPTCRKKGAPPLRAYVAPGIEATSPRSALRSPALAPAPRSRSPLPLALPLTRPLPLPLPAPARAPARSPAPAHSPAPAPAPARPRRSLTRARVRSRTLPRPLTRTRPRPLTRTRPRPLLARSGSLAHARSPAAPVRTRDARRQEPWSAAVSAAVRCRPGSAIRAQVSPAAERGPRAWPHRSRQPRRLRRPVSARRQRARACR
jgi:hypothetical protein